MQLHNPNGTLLPTHSQTATMTTPDWLNRLNPPQRRAVVHQHGPLLVLAGAGSGKTRVLTHRIAHLIDVGDVAPESIVAVTFTNRAAGEMRQRVDTLIGDDEKSSQIVISTFHSLGARLLRRYAPQAGLPWSFCIYDDTDQRRLIKTLLDEMGRDRSRAAIGQHRRYVDACKNRGWDPDQAMENAFDATAEENAAFYDRYQQALYRAGAVDFGDLILEPLLLCRRAPRFARRLSRRWQYVLVDEFQDTNPAQYELLEHITADHNNLAVVGDDDQAIYRWRGADSTHILGFEEEFDAPCVVKLEQNYRSTGLILDAANDVIAHNDHRHPKTLWTDRPRGEPICVFTGSDDREEASYVAESIFNELRKGAEPDDFAIFYRTNAQGRLFEEQLRQWGVDYRIVGGLSFYDREEIKDVLAYLRAALNPGDDVATARIINKPRRGVGKTTVEKMRASLSIDGIDHLQDAASIADEASPDQDDLFMPRGQTPAQQEALDALRSLRGVSRRGVASFRQILEEIRDDLLHFETLTPVVERLLERTAYTDHLQKGDPDEADDRLRNIGELMSAIEEFERDPTTPRLLETAREAIPEDAGDSLATAEASLRLRAFLDRSALVRQSVDDATGGAVTLMTVHGAKGLEFDTVFLVGMEEETFPHLRDRDDAEEAAEERRLAYVAITRAKNRLFITNARRRRVYGKFRNTEPSRYLLDIDPDHLHIDPRSSSTKIDYGRPRHRRSHSGSSSSFRRRNASSSWNFDQSTGDDDDESFNQSLPDWEPSADQSHPDFDKNPDPTVAEQSLVGATVSHTKFGVGEVLSISGCGDEARLSIDFPAVGQKTVYRKFLKILG